MSEPSWEATRQQLIRRLREHAIHYGPTLAEPGVVTDVFIDPSQVTLRGDGLALIEALLGAPAPGGSRRGRWWPGDGRDPTRDPAGAPAVARLLYPAGPAGTYAALGDQRHPAAPRHGGRAAGRSGHHRDLPADLL